MFINQRARVTHIGSAQDFAKKGWLKTASNIDLSQFLLSQVTIVCGVYPETVTVNGKSYSVIDESCSHLVNQNGDAWLNQVILETYHTLKGAFNFVEHDQRIEENKGRLLDAMIRKVELIYPDLSAPMDTLNQWGWQDGVATPSSRTPQKMHTNKATVIIDPKTGEAKYSYYVDILVATNVKYKRLIEQILDGSYNAMSMGCVVEGSTCSFCGREMREPYPMFCSCLLNDRCTMKWHPELKRKVAVAELCGIPGEPDTNIFVESSWVKDPAFVGAQKAFIIGLPGSLKKSYSISGLTPGQGTLAKVASAGHEAVVFDNTTMRNTAMYFSRNPIIRQQLNRYLHLYGFSIDPMTGRSSYPVQIQDTNEYEKVQTMFKQLNLK